MCVVAFVALSCLKDERLAIVFGGDVMLDRGIRAKINVQGLPYLTEDISEVFRDTDFTVINLECPVTNVHAPETKKFVFRADPEWLAALRGSGITHCIVANNHSYDHGRKGLVATSSNLKNNNLIPVGYGTTQREACSPIIFEKDGVKVALFSSVILPLESWMYLEDSPGMCQASVNDLTTSVAAYKKLNPKTYVIITLHWGVEYEPFPTVMQRQQARQLIEAGADALIGHHPHVVQSFESIDGKPVFYSLGNLIFDNPNPQTHEGILVKLEFTKTQQAVEIIPYKAVLGKPLIMSDEDRVKMLDRFQKISGSLPF
jgi:poly-gamma-glutamate capsule biosynthesis protein CapA/YwtB (metallophosphatase superfamily)